jgi:o-succinylbenzoate synthase
VSGDELRVHRLRVGARDVTLLHGPAGWGECSPLPGYPCDPARAWRAAEEAARDGFPPPRRDSVPVNALVERADFDPATLGGFDAVKVKLREPADLELVARVRNLVGSGVSLRVDANGAFDVETARGLLPALARLDVELVEQPVASLEDMARLRRQSPLPLAADESVRSVDEARQLRALEAADAVVLKVQPLGGVRAALDVADAAGVPAIPTSMMETSIGIAAGLALACALPKLVFACGLATAALLPADVTPAPLLPVHGRLTRRLIEPDPELLQRYALPSASSQALSS